MSVEIASAMRKSADMLPSDTSVAVVITTYNHAHFLGDAIKSVLAQTRLPDEIVVVDDGSVDHPERVVGNYRGVRFIHQSNQGLAAARNTGLCAVKSEAVVFLDADDRLLRSAIAAGLRSFATAPLSAFVYGGHRRISADGHRIGGERYDAIGTNPYATLLSANVIGMHATVMYRRQPLIAAGGFDATLRRCEDYDVYLRLAQHHSVTSYPEVVAEYRWHDGNVSRHHREMLQWVLRVHDRQRASASMAPETARAWRRGRASWRDYYGGEMLVAAKEAWRETGTLRKTLPLLTTAAVLAPDRVANELFIVGKRRLRRAKSKTHAPKFGSIRFGDFDRLYPIGGNFGYARGTPIDRYYVENFLASHADDIAGRVLEIGDDSYTRRFGGPRVAQTDVLHVDGGNPDATIVGDLASPGVLPAGAFDCLVITQTLHLIYDVRAAVREIHRALKPGGVALVTVPGISQIDCGEWKERWHWSLTSVSARRLFSETFGEDAVVVESRGNVFAATAFLHGIALEEIERTKLDHRDEAYPVIVSVSARKQIGLEVKNPR